MLSRACSVPCRETRPVVLLGMPLHTRLMDLWVQHIGVCSQAPAVGALHAPLSNTLSIFGCRRIGSPSPVCMNPIS